MKTFANQSSTHERFLDDYYLYNFSATVEIQQVMSQVIGGLSVTATFGSQS